MLQVLSPGGDAGQRAGEATGDEILPTRMTILNGGRSRAAAPHHSAVAPIRGDPLRFTPWRRIAGATSRWGAGGALANIYALRPETLAALLNAYRAQALRQAGPSPSAPWRANEAAPHVTFGRKI